MSPSASLPTAASGGPPRLRYPRAWLGLVVLGVLAILALAGPRGAPVSAQACPPYCETPVITPAWHMHMCDEPYQEQLDDNHCMRGKGVTEFAGGTDRVYIIYCHRLSDTVTIQVKDSGGGLQFVNHPDGITYTGEGCETLVFSRPNGIPAGGSPYFTSAHWPEGPFTGVGAGIEWYIGLFLAFDQDIYYGNAAQAHLTARDPAANQDPFVSESIQVRVSSTSDPTGITLVLTEQVPGSGLFKSDTPLRFNQRASDPRTGTIRVNDRDVLTASYCPRNCSTPYTDSATWYQLEVTVTPTPLPTWAGPAPTATATPPDDLPVSYLTLRPAPADVGYVPQVGTNKDRVNHLGYPAMYTGMWTRGRNIHHGMARFDLGELPEGARIIDARLELVGRESTYTESGSWSVAILDAAIDAGWRSAGFDAVHGAAVAARLEPALSDADLAPGRRNAFGFAGAPLAALNARLAGSRMVSFRMDGPAGEDNNLFAWESGVDTYNRAPEPPDPALGPVLHLAYTLPMAATSTPLAASGTPTAPPATGTPSASAPAPSASPSGTASPPAGTAGPGPTLSPSATPSPRPGASASPSPSATRPGPTPEPATATPSGPADQRQVCVLAFDDADGDGRRGHEERFLAGVTLRLTHERSGVFDTWTTDGANDPDHCWSGLVDGDYSLRVVGLPHGLVSSGADRLSFAVPFPGPPRSYAFGARRADLPTPTQAPTPSPIPTPSPSPSAEPTVAGPSGQICLGIFEDPDRDGFRGPEEVWLSGVETRVLDEARQPVREIVSRAEGPLCLRLPVGIYYAAAVPPTGWLVTTPGEVPVLLSEGVRRDAAFGLAGAQVHLPMLLREGPRSR